MNQVTLIGNLANDPESRVTNSGKAQCSFRLAVQRRFANAQGVREADFLNVVCWGKTAENCARYLAKGRKAAVQGSIQNRSYDAHDGSKRYVTEIIAEYVEFIGGGERGGQNAQPQNEQDSNAQPQQPQSYGSQVSMYEGFTEVEDDDLPF